MKKHFILATFLASILQIPLGFATVGSLVSDSNEANVYPDGVIYSSLESGETDYTTAAASGSGDLNMPDKTSSSDITLIDYLYIGSESPFDLILFDVITAGSSSRPLLSCGGLIGKCKHYDLEYYNGVSNEWKSLNYTDNTNNFQTVQKSTVEFEIPDAWEDPENVNTSIEGETLYWVRFSPNENATISSQALVEEIGLRSYHIKLTIKDELGNLFKEVDDDDVIITEGMDNTLHGYKNNGDGTYSLALDTETDNAIYYYAVSDSSYIENASATGHMGSTQKNLQYIAYYPHLITVLDEKGDALIPDSVVINGVGEFSDPTCIISSNIAYCAVNPTEDGSITNMATVTVSKSGYESVTKNLAGERTNVSDDAIETEIVLTTSEPSTPTTPADQTATVSILLTDEEGNAITGLDQNDFEISGGTNNSIQSFSTSSGSYTLTLAAEEADSDYTITVEPDGYVSTSITTGTLTDGESVSDTVALDFAFKVVVKNASGSAINSADVSAGDGLSTDCETLGSGLYGCAIPVNDSSTGYRVEADGYYVLYKNFSSDRDDASDASIIAYPVLRAEQEDSCEVPFDDIYGHWAEGYIQELYCREVVKGRSANAYAPNEEVTRAEFLKIALLNAGLDPEGATEEDFDDVDTGDWFYEYVAYGAEEGFIEGYDDGSFRPNDSINRAEALVISMRIAEVDKYTVSSSWDIFDDVDHSDWYAYAVKEAKEESIVEGYSDNTFRPGNKLTRAEIATIAVRTYEAYYE